jgi:hypothetical protein
LVVPNDLEISNAKLQWTGLVLVQSSGSNVQFNIGSGGTGFINGALLLQAAAGSSANLISGSGFQISYSCDAIDMAFGSLPLKVVASSQTSY